MRNISFQIEDILLNSGNENKRRDCCLQSLPGDSRSCADKVLLLWYEKLEWTVLPTWGACAGGERAVHLQVWCHHLDKVTHPHMWRTGRSRGRSTSGGIQTALSATRGRSSGTLICPCLWVPSRTSSPPSTCPWWAPQSLLGAIFSWSGEYPTCSDH